VKRMVITRAPLRVSFVGGGSDLPPGEGTVVSSTIQACLLRRAPAASGQDFADVA
jgi:galactokinase/mevalonate kinase-like predicted kinase